MIWYNALVLGGWIDLPEEVKRPCRCAHRAWRQHKWRQSVGEIDPQLNGGDGVLTDPQNVFCRSIFPQASFRNILQPSLCRSSYDLARQHWCNGKQVKKKEDDVEQSSYTPPFRAKGMCQSEVAGKHRKQAEMRRVTHWKGTQCIPFKFRIKPLLSPQIAFVGSGTVLN